MGKLANMFTRKFNVQGLTVQIGIHSGPLISGLTTGMYISFDVWGEVCTIVEELAASAPPGAILVSEESYWYMSSRPFLFETHGYHNSKEVVSTLKVYRLLGRNDEESEEAFHFVG